jgi:WD40 repeat protein
MFSGRHRVTADHEGSYFLDRDPKIFRHVLNYLRTHEINLEVYHDPCLKYSILNEFDYFCIPPPANLRCVNSMLEFTHFVPWKKFPHTFLGISDVRLSGRMVIACGKPARSKPGLVVYNENGEMISTFLEDQKIYCAAALGNTIIAGGKTDIWVIDLNTHTEKHIPTAHEGSITCLKIWGGCFITCSKDGSIKIWDLISSQPITIMKRHPSHLLCVDMNDELIVSGSDDCNVQIWERNTGKCTSVLSGHGNWVWCIAVCEDKIISGSSDKTVRVWDSINGTCIRTFGEHTHTIFSLNVLDGAILSASGDKTVKLWNIDSTESALTLEAHQDRVISVDSRGCVVASMSEDGFIRLWKGTVFPN